MASMAAAVSAARTAALAGNRTLDERERSRYCFSPVKPAARRAKLDKQKILEQYGYPWEPTPPRQSPGGASTEEQSAGGPPAEERRQQGRCIAEPGAHQDITWQDEHSAPFSWETRSQMEFSVASLPAQEQCATPLLPAEPRPPSKAVQGTPASKGPHGTQPTKPSQVSKAPSIDGSISSRKEEESAFWKISAERSKIDGEEAEFQSLTPSQIKSLEKGEKSLPPYYRQESGSKETMSVEKPAVNKEDKQTAQSFFSVTSPSKTSAAYPSVVAAAYPSTTSVASPSKASAAYPIVTSAPYPAATTTGMTMATFASKATAAYTSDYAAAASCASKARPSQPLRTAFAAPPNLASADYEKPRPNQSSVSSMDEVFISEGAKQTLPVSKAILHGAVVELEGSSLLDQQRSAQINANNVVLKTGFDFLDNW